MVQSVSLPLDEVACAPMKVFDGATVVRPSPRIKALSGALAIVGLVMAVAAIELGPALWVLAVVTAVAGMVGFALVRSTNVLALRSGEPVAVGREGIFEGEQLIVKRGTVRAALPGYHHVLGPVLLLLRRSDTVFVQVDKLETAREMQQALELGVEQRNAAVRFRAPMRLRVAALASLFLFMAATMRLFQTPAMLVLEFLLAWRIVAWDTVLTVGDDGLSLRTLWREQFIAFPEIEDVGAGYRHTDGREHRFGVRITLRSGRNIALLPSRELSVRFGLPHSDQPVIERARDALDLYRARLDPALVLPAPLSAPHAGSSADRVRALTRKHERIDVYRRTAVDQDGLRRAVDDPGLAPRTRAEAAVSLAALGNADDLELIHRAAERSACSRLRKLFEIVAAGADPARLARALDRVP